MILYNLSEKGRDLNNFLREMTEKDRDFTVSHQ